IFRRGDDIVDAFLAPSLHAADAKNLFGKVERSRQANTAVTEGTHVAFKQTARGTVVQIDIVWIWENELYATERSVGPRPLPQLIRKMSGSNAGPVDRTGVRHLIAPDHFKALRGQAPGVFSEYRQFLVDGDVRRHVPVRIEFEKPDAVAEHRRPV